MYQSWVGSNKFSYYFSMIFKLGQNDPKLGAPLILNQRWASVEWIHNLVKLNWLRCDP